MNNFEHFYRLSGIGVNHFIFILADLNIVTLLITLNIKIKMINTLQ